MIIKRYIRYMKFEDSVEKVLGLFYRERNEGWLPLQPFDNSPFSSLHNKEDFYGGLEILQHLHFVEAFKSHDGKVIAKITESGISNYKAFYE